MPKRILAIGLASALLGTSLLGAGRARASTPGCAAGAAGGEWREYSHDLANSRHQPAEDQIGPARAANLAPAWKFSAAAAGGAGEFQNDPIVADGCVYLASNGGSVFALNADSGEVVWRAQLDTAVSSSPAVANGRVYLHANRRDNPYLVVLDQSSGHELWRAQLDDQPNGSELLSSPKVFGGLIFSAISGAGAEAGTTFTGNPQKRLHFRGIYTLTDDVTHEVLYKGYTIPDADFARGYSGGGLWSSAAVDTATGYAYVGSGNPFSPDEHPNTNSILKIDVDPHRPTFGAIVAHYHGTNDQYVDGLTTKPQCAAYVDVFTCETSDFDFGATPQLFTDASGRSVVGDHQKSGVYHVADASTMAGLWKQTVGGPFGWFGGEGTASFDGQSVIVAGNIPGVLSSLRGSDGARNWVTPIADGIHFQSVTTANGVAYAIDTRGLLDIWDTATGLQLAVKAMGQEIGSPTTGAFSTGYSIAVARHTVFVPYGDTLVAYR